MSEPLSETGTRAGTDLTTAHDDTHAIKAVVDQLVFNDDGLIPVVTQEANTQQVLMLGYMNIDALHETIRSGYATYFSRSRQRLWRKGETSGNLQEVVSIAQDCDSDTLLLAVNQTGPACHTGSETCFTGREFFHRNF